MANSGTSCVPHPLSCVCWLKHKWVVLVEKKKKYYAVKKFKLEQ